MAMAKNTDVLRYALQQYGYTESPAGSNNNKFGREFGMNYEPWCAEFVWACGENVSGANPIYKSANAAYIQDETVSKKGGSWVMQKTASTKTKKAGLSKVRLGDIVDFDFGAGDKVRDHTSLAVGRWGDCYVCIEGNTSFSNSGSQSNGGCVALRFRKYTEVCSIVRPKYTKEKWYKPTSPYAGTLPKLPSRGYFKYGDKSGEVKKLQKALAWANGYALKADKDFGGKTFAEVVIFQLTWGLMPDGEFGEKSLGKMSEVIKELIQEEAA